MKTIVRNVTADSRDFDNEVQKIVDLYCSQGYVITVVSNLVQYLSYTESGKSRTDTYYQDLRFTENRISLSQTFVFVKE